LFFEKGVFFTMTSIIYWNTFYPSSLSTNTSWDDRLNTCARVLITLKPDIIIWQDAFNLPNLSDELYCAFVEYTPHIFKLQSQGDEGIKCFFYCVLVKNSYKNLMSIEAIDIGNTRYAVKITTSHTKILATYLEYCSSEIREEQLKNILNCDVDIICGLNVIFCDVWREYFGNIFRILRNWKKIGLLICQPTVRQLHTPKKILYKNEDPGYQWEISSECKESYPLKFFMNSFLESNVLLRITGRIWRAIFNRPVLALDHILVKRPSNLYVHPSILTGGDIKDVAGHAILKINIKNT
jgi:hypothetical protein